MTQRLRIGLPGAVAAATGLLILLAGQAYAASAGDLDRTFAGDGRKLHDLTGRAERALDVVALPNGKIVVAAGDADLELARLRRGGRLDRAFGRRGVTMVPNPFGLNRAGDLALQRDGKIVVVGHSNSAVSGADALLLARHDRNGKPDQSFGDGGFVRTDLDETSIRGSGLAIQDDGGIVVSGYRISGGLVARFLPDGALDPGFGDEGVQRAAPIDYRPVDVAVQPDGRIVATGVAGEGFAVVRYLTDGSPDPSFGDGGAASTMFSSHPGRFGTGPEELALQPNGRIVVAGTWALHLGMGGSRFAIARFRPSGRLDRSFSGDGKRRTSFYGRPPPPSHQDVAHAVALAPKGRIVVAGHVEAFRDDADFALARYLGH